MIDTIVLILNQHMFRVFKQDLFEPHASVIFNYRMPLGRKGYITAKQNPTEYEQKNDPRPRLTLTRRYTGISVVTLKLEFSAPKLLLNNNFDELEDKHLPLLVLKLVDKLRDMGVATTTTDIKNGLVSSIHYSKNIPLTNGLTPFALLKEIQKAKISKRLDFNQTDYRNEGHSIKFRTNSYEIAFYDKMRDMQSARISNKRAEENDNGIQVPLFEKLETYQRFYPLEVIRMEIRLNQRQKIEAVLKKVGFDIKPTLENLFKQNVAQKVLLFHLDLIEDSIPKSYYFGQKSVKDFVAGFIVDNPKEKIKDAVLAYGFNRMLRELSTREIRALFERKPVSSWYRFIQKMNSYNHSNTRASDLELIRNAITNYIPLKTDDYQV